MQLQLIQRIIKRFVTPEPSIDPSIDLSQYTPKRAYERLADDVNHRIFWRQLKREGLHVGIEKEIQAWHKQNKASDPLPHLLGLIQRANLEMIRLKTQVAEKTVAFFLPSKSFHGHFGDIPAELVKQGYRVMNFYGTVDDERVFDEPGNYLLIGDMCPQVKGPHMIVTAQIMDCLPDSVIRVLVDHLSFARFDMDSLFERMDSPVPLTSQTPADLIQEVSAYIAFFPLVDVHVVPTTVLSHTVEACANRWGYRLENVEDYDGPQKSPHTERILEILGDKRIAQKCVIVPGGYPKLDDVYRSSSTYKPEKILTYSPTPNDKSGNKGGSDWADFMSINKFGASIVTELCKEFPDYKIVFKPHADEIKEVVDRVVEAGSLFPNFELDKSGSSYWKLYQKTGVLISDFSSTAFTFAMGMNRPVAFFSHNEAELNRTRPDNSYCRYRADIGEICVSEADLVKKVRAILENYEHYTRKIDTTRRRYCYNAGDSSEVIAQHLVSLLKLHDDAERLVLKRH